MTMIRGGTRVSIGRRQAARYSVGLAKLAATRMAGAAWSRAGGPEGRPATEVRRAHPVPVRRPPSSYPRPPISS